MMSRFIDVWRAYAKQESLRQWLAVGWAPWCGLVVRPCAYAERTARTQHRLSRHTKGVSPRPAIDMSCSASSRFDETCHSEASALQFIR